MPSRKWLLFLAAVSAVMGLMAQSITSSLIGTVTDSSGAVVPNATIIATNVATNARGQAATDSVGNYLLLQLSPGSYTVEVSAPGFKKSLHSAIVLELQEQARLDVKLEVGSASDTVTVKADASALETTTSTIGQVVDNREILNLPLNTRNVYSLIYLTPGVAGSIGNDYNSLTYSINGTRVTWRSSRVSASFLHRPSTASSTSFISKKRSARTKWAGDTSSLIWQGRAAARPSIMAAQQRRPTFASFLFCAWPATRYSSFMLWAYTKYHALGNDYIVIDPKNLPLPLTTAQVKTICHRNFGKSF